MRYFEYVSIDVDDRTIPCHPLIDQCNGSLVYRLLEHLGIPCADKSVLDLGSGTGQVVRLLRGIPNLRIEACDVDPAAKTFFATHPELSNIRFHQINVITDRLPGTYDAIVLRGVYHHIPKRERARLLKRIAEQTPLIIVADEGIAEYSTFEERLRNCSRWYGYVIKESERRGLQELARLEKSFLDHERLASADDNLDFKESPTELTHDAQIAGLRVTNLDLLGPWETSGGGFFTAIIQK